MPPWRPIALRNAPARVASSLVSKTRKTFSLMSCFNIHFFRGLSNLTVYFLFKFRSYKHIATRIIQMPVTGLRIPAFPDVCCIL